MGTEYQISPRTISRHLKWRGVKELLCFRCGKRICPGDWIHRNDPQFSVKVPLKADARFYHLVCYEDMFLDV